MDKAKANAVKVVCIECKDPAAIVCVDVSGEYAGTRFQCCECEANWGTNDVRDYLEAAKGWAKMLAWLEAFPQD